MSLLQREYIQKSRIFLLPLTGVRKDRIYKPTNTYIASPNLSSKEYPSGISPEDETLIMVFTKDYERRENDSIIRHKLNTLVGNWEKFETETMMSNRNFVGLYESKDEYIYTFDLSDWSLDWSNFVRGSYSEMSSDAKEAILKFRWSSLKPDEQKKLYCYLYPYKKECLESFARELQMNPEDLREAKELCSKPDIFLETFVYDDQLSPSEEIMMDDESKD